MNYGDPKAKPVHGDVIEVTVRIRVGYSNGDFRRITVVDAKDRPIAHGQVPFRALRELEEGS